VLDAYRYGKPIGVAGGAEVELAPELISYLSGPGLYLHEQNDAEFEGAELVTDLAAAMKEGLRQFKFLDRFPAYEPMT
jgi:hypothetical protein